MSADFDGLAGGNCPTEPSTATLVREILEDVHQLIEQQVELTRRQLVDEFQNLKWQLAVMGIGVLILVVDAFVLCLTLVHLLHWLAMPAGVSEVARLPLWVCYGIVSLVLLIAGALTVRFGQVKFSASIQQGMRSLSMSAAVETSDENSLTRIE